MDGWYIPEDLSSIFAGGKQNPVDILVGSNRDEGTFFVRPGSSTQQEYLAQTRERFGDLAGDYLKLTRRLPMPTRKLRALPGFATK